MEDIIINDDDTVEELIEKAKKYLKTLPKEKIDKLISDWTTFRDESDQILNGEWIEEGLPTVSILLHIINSQEVLQDLIKIANEVVGSRKRYLIDFYDSFDGWVGGFETFPEYQFDDLDKAKEMTAQQLFDKSVFVVAFQA